MLLNNKGITEILYQIAYIKYKKHGVGMRQPVKKDLYDKFINWYILPAEKKEKIRIKTESDFARKHDISRKQVYIWKKRADFIPNIRKAFDKLSTNEKAKLYYSLLNNSGKSPRQAELWLELFYLREKSNTEGYNIIVDTSGLYSKNE